MYRLHLDVPCGTDQKEAIELANYFKFWLLKSFDGHTKTSGLEIGVRLGNDTDRSNKDYLRINENGHAANGKQKIVI